jgi:hypothetical protein
MYIQCTLCKENIKRWKSDIDRIKNINLYVCKKCIYKNSREIKTCPVCNKEYESLKKQNKKTCSYSCSNKFFRTGENNGNWKEHTYRTTCFSKHEKKCIACDESKIVEVHHYNGNHKDNRIENLVPICPTHHKYIHSRYANEILPIVEKYVKNFIAKLGDTDNI